MSGSLITRRSQVQIPRWGESAMADGSVAASRSRYETGTVRNPIISSVRARSMLGWWPLS
jgi:hypothetical protein